MQENFLKTDININEAEASNNTINDILSLINALDEKIWATNDILNIENTLTNKDDDFINNNKILLNLPEEINQISIEDVDNLWYDEIEKIINKIDSEEILNIKQDENTFDDSLWQELIKLNKNRRYKKIKSFIVDKIKFAAHYVIVSSLVFFILLWGINYSAYSKIAYDYINPDNLKNSSKEILNTIDNSKIKVFADEETWFLAKWQEEVIQKKLAEDNLQLRETYFSPKKLVPLKSNVNMDVEILPYENRIVIPKIGKNIPLVDVDSRRWNLDFKNLENLFMKELEKWVLRYPWTAKPWENGNTFIFWHSSNYAWEHWEFNDVFALLDKLDNWDEIIVYYNQKKYTYVVNEKKVISPGDVKVLDRDPTKKELSLMTCWPVWTAYNRLIAFAELKEITNQ